MAFADQKVYKMVFNAGSQLYAATAPFLFSLDGSIGQHLIYKHGANVF